MIGLDSKRLVTMAVECQLQFTWSAPAERWRRRRFLELTHWHYDHSHDPIVPPLPKQCRRYRSPRRRLLISRHNAALLLPQSGTAALLEFRAG